MSDFLSSQGRCGTMGRFFSLVACLGWTVTAASAEPQVPREKLTPVQRMAPLRLKAAHEDVLRIQRSRRSLPGRRSERLPGDPSRSCRGLVAHGRDPAGDAGRGEAGRRDAILLTDHYRPPRDFVNESWRGLREGVLFIPGSEERGFLLYPAHSIMDRMNEPLPEFIQAVRADGGLIFLSHIEERPDHSMAGLDGMEIYNRHADAKKDAAGLLALVLKLTSPSSLKELQDLLRDYPDELFAFQVEYPALYLAKWDRETAGRRLTGVAANDCHHNMVMVVKMASSETVKVGTIVDKDEDMRSISATLRPGIRELTRGHQPGDILARVDLDPYHRSFRNVCTHILAPELTEPAIREALRAGTRTSATTGCATRRASRSS